MNDESIPTGVAPQLEVASGIILVGVGVLLVTDRLSWLNTRFQFMAEWISAAEKALQ